MELDKKIENREKNLTLHYESVRKDLDIVLTSTIPTQKNLMKTILWINASIIGAVVVQEAPLLYFKWLLIPFFFSFFAILLIVYSLKKGQTKSFGEADINKIEQLASDKFEHIHGLSIMMYTAKDALEQNLIIVAKRAKNLSGAITFTLVSLLALLLYIVLILNIKLR